MVLESSCAISRQIRVLLLADGMPAGGTERQIILLLKGLRVFCPDITTFFGVLVKNGEREKEAVGWADTVLPIRQSHQMDFSLAWSLVSLIKKYDIDIVHTFGSVSDLSGVVAAKCNQVKLVNGSLRSARRRLNRRDRLSKLAMRFADVIVANSNAGCKAFKIENWNNVKTIYNGLDVERFDNVEAFQNSVPYICMVANFTAKKDHHALVKALPAVLREFPNIHLLLVGKGDQKEDCHRLIHELGLENSIFIIDNCNEPEMYIKGAEICLLLSSDGEGISNVILEYLALSSPVIATASGGTVEVIRDKKTGLLLRSHEKNEVSSAITLLLRNNSYRLQLGQAGKKDVRERFSFETMVDKYSGLYRNLIFSQRK